MRNIRWRSRVKEVLSEFSSVDFLCYMKVWNGFVTVSGLNHWRRKQTSAFRSSVWISIISAWCLQFSVNTTFTSYSSQHRNKKWCLTSESPVCSVDSPENHTAASLLNPAACWNSGPDVSDGRGWTSELRAENHSWSLTNCSHQMWIKNKLHR